MKDALELAQGRPDLEAAVRKSRKLLHQKALLAALASALPVPGLDGWVDAALMSRLVARINEEFGLTAARIDRLSPQRKEQFQKAMTLIGAFLIGRFVNADWVKRLGKRLAIQLGKRQLARWIPIAGQALAALMGYATIRALGEHHIRECVLARRALTA
jgi:uncharacterized protein (DUF697 family)